MTGLGEGRGVIMRGGPPVLDDRVGGGEGCDHERWSSCT